MNKQPKLLTPAQVADLYAVDPKTVTRWAKAGRLTELRTLGGQRRFPADQPALAEALALRNGTRR